MNLVNPKEMSHVVFAIKLEEKHPGVNYFEKGDKIVKAAKAFFTLKERNEDIPHQYIQLSNHLDFVGVELQATFVQTRKVNGEQLQDRIKNTVGPWKAGRFMTITMRPYSANTYALSKVWFKCGSINLRVSDINTINSNVKSGLYQDLFEKPG